MYQGRREGNFPRELCISLPMDRTRHKGPGGKEEGTTKKREANNSGMIGEVGRLRSNNRVMILHTSPRSLTIHGSKEQPFSEALIRLKKKNLVLFKLNNQLFYLQRRHLSTPKSENTHSSSFPQDMFSGTTICDHQLLSVSTASVCLPASQHSLWN